MNQKGQETSPPMVLERRKTLTMTWEGLGDDDDDNNFFESFDRLSSAVSIDLASSGSDDDEYDDGRMSFASAISSISIKSSMSSAPMEDLSVRNDTNIFGDYNMWMSEPGPIKERRQRLFQDMGLSSNKNLLKKVLSKKTVPENEQQKVKKDDVSEKVPKQKELPVSEVVLVRSRSDGDIDTCSVNTKMRKEELVGTVSKQRLTRTSSTLLTPQAGIYPYAMRVSQNRNKERGTMNEANAMSSIMSNGHFGSFFLIKDLDSGKEFIVKEFNDDGMWNRLSEVQTGKQLTMEEFEKSVGYSPVVKELMRRENISRGLENGRKISANSYFSKSFRNSKRRGAALLKNIKGVANSISGSIVEREKEHIHTETEQQRNNNNSNNNKNLSSKWIKVRQQGKSIKEFTAMHLCQEIQAHEGSIWTIKFSPDARFLASAGEDKIVHVWEVQECEVMSDLGFATSASSPDHPSLGDISPLPSERGKERAPLAELSPMPTNKKRGKGNSKKKGNSIPDYVYVPETVFSLSEKPVCSFSGHQDDVLDLSWSKSQLLLSASMDKTVRLWDMETKSCLKLFAHNDYVTCIQFNPIDDNYFISGSLDAKVRIWSIPDRQLVDYTDLHEMVTAARYTPDGQGALIGSHKGGYRLYSTTDCCLEQKDQIELRHKKKKEAKKITGFEFAPGNPSEVLVTSADSRIRIVDSSDVTHKFRGFRNTSSQISASFSADGKYIVSASEDSQVYIWKRGELRNSGTGKSKGVLTTYSHEHFQCKDVSVATPWPGSIKHEPPLVEVHSKRHSKRFISPQSYRDENTLGVSSRQMLPPLPKKTSVIDEDQNLEDGTHSKRHLPPLPKKNVNLNRSPSCQDEEPTQRKLPPRPKKNSSIDEHASNHEEDYTGEKSKRHSPPHGASENTISTKKNTSFDRASSCLEEDPSHVSRTDSEMGIGDSFSSDYSSIRYGDSSSISASSNSASQSWSSSWSIAEGNNSPGGNTIQANAWGMVIVTAGLGGEIRAYQNLGLPVKVGRQANLFRDLDSNLLSAISARIGRKREKVGERKMREKEFAFDWPANELKALVEGGERRERDGAVDLTEDNGVINGVEEREEEIGCDLFGRFEETALKRLRG